MKDGYLTPEDTRWPLPIRRKGDDDIIGTLEVVTDNGVMRLRPFAGCSLEGELYVSFTDPESGTHYQLDLGDCDDAYRRFYLPEDGKPQRFVRAEGNGMNEQEQPRQPYELLVVKDVCRQQDRLTLVFSWEELRRFSRPEFRGLVRTALNEMGDTLLAAWDEAYADPEAA